MIFIENTIISVLHLLLIFIHSRSRSNMCDDSETKPEDTMDTKVNNAQKQKDFLALDISSIPKVETINTFSLS